MGRPKSSAPTLEKILFCRMTTSDYARVQRVAKARAKRIGSTDVATGVRAILLEAVDLEEGKGK